MDFLAKYRFFTHVYGGTIRSDRQLSPTNIKRGNSKIFNSTAIIITIAFLLFIQIQAETPNFFWDTDADTELKILQSVLQVQQDKIDKAVKIFKDLNDYTNYYLIYMVIKRGYDNNVKNVHKLVNFIIELPWCNHQYAGFQYLFDELKRNKQLHSFESIQFAFRLKKFLDGNQTCNHIKDNKRLLENVNALKENFSETTRLIVWKDSKLCLKHLVYNEHLYAAECCQYDKERRRLFTWIPKGEIGPNGEFTLEPIDDIASVFRIKSDIYKEYIYAAECCKYDGERRNIFSWIPKSDIGPLGEWIFERHNASSNSFRIKNNYYGEYLYAAECCAYDKERRSLFTWIPKGDVGAHGDWEIVPC